MRAEHVWRRSPRGPMIAIPGAGRPAPAASGQLPVPVVWVRQSVNVEVCQEMLAQGSAIDTRTKSSAKVSPGAAWYVTPSTATCAFSTPLSMNRPTSWSDFPFTTVVDPVCAWVGGGASVVSTGEGAGVTSGTNGSTPVNSGTFGLPWSVSSGAEGAGFGAWIGPDGAAVERGAALPPDMA